MEHTIQIYLVHFFRFCVDLFKKLCYNYKKYHIIYIDNQQNAQKINTWRMLVCCFCDLC